MANLLTKEVGNTGLSPAKALGVALSKVLTERAISMTPLGNGTLLSGASKMLGAGVLTYMTKSSKTWYGQAGNIVGIGLMVDGGEDLVLAGSKWLSNRNGGSASDAVKQGGNSAEAGNLPRMLKSL